MATDLKGKMDAFERMMHDESFIQGRGQGNELSYFVFDYDPKEEIFIRDFVRRIARQSVREVSVVNLYQSALSIFEEEVGIDVLLELEAQQGTRTLHDAMMPMLESERLIQAIVKQAENAEIVMLTGVGSLYPLMRSHTVLNRLHEWLFGIPVVLFFPGTYNGRQLMLFNLLTDDNYYRAFRISAS